MQSNQSYKTAYTAAYARLIEQYEPDKTRLFNDPLIKLFFSNYISFLLKFNAMRKILILMYNLTITGLLGLQVCRTKYIDDILKKAVDEGISQVVILGTGFDTRAYRISSNNQIMIFEADLSIILDRKESIIKNYLGVLPENIVFTPIDFNCQKLDEILEAKGLNLSKPVLFIWEGVTQYITEDAIDNTLKFISKSSSGSRLVFTYVLKRFIDGTSDMVGVESLLTTFKSEEQPFYFGLNPSELGEFLSKYNLSLIEDVGGSYYQENYLKPLGRNLFVSKLERIAYARIP